jgi:hypothetical protein
MSTLVVVATGTLTPDACPTTCPSGITAIVWAPPVPVVVVTSGSKFTTDGANAVALEADITATLTSPILTATFTTSGGGTGGVATFTSLTPSGLATKTKKGSVVVVLDTSTFDCLFTVTVQPIIPPSTPDTNWPIGATFNQIVTVNAAGQTVLKSV